MNELQPTNPEQTDLLAAIRVLIAEARSQTAVTVNAALTLLYWRIGKQIYTDVLGSERAPYGDQIVATLRIASAKNIQLGRATTNPAL